MARTLATRLALRRTCGSSADRYCHRVEFLASRGWSLAGEDSRTLAGGWLVHKAGPGEWRTVADRALNESDWQTTSTPGVWWLDDGFASEQAVLYRRHFELPTNLASPLEATDPEWTGLGAIEHNGAEQPEARWWLVASGLCDLGHLWLDGSYLGDLRGRHAEHAFEVTELLRTGREHLAAVEAGHGQYRVAKSDQSSPVETHSNPAHADAVQEAIAQLCIQRTGPIRIERIRALVIEASPDRAVLRITATLDSAGTHRGRLTTTVLPADRLAADSSPANRLQAAVATNDWVPAVARPADRGSVDRPPVDETGAGEFSSEGLRTTERSANANNNAAKSDATPDNGLTHSEQVLARGRNELEWLVALNRPSLWWPTGMGAQDLYAITVEIAVDGRSSDIVRLPTGVRAVAIRRGQLVVNGEAHRGGPNDMVLIAHQVGHHSFYEAANKRGDLVCQQITLDPSLFSGADRSRRALAARAIAASVDQAGHHPCIAAWQPVGVSPDQGREAWRSPAARRILRRNLRATDPTRPVYLRPLQSGRLV